jgi:hypothetical protein
MVPYIRLIVCVALLGTASCAIRGNDRDHYLGPVIFRQANETARVFETWHLGVLGEAGGQNGLSAGAVHRVAAEPVDTDTGPTRSPSGTPHLDASLPSVPLPFGDWRLSPIYLEQAHAPSGGFVMRTLVGSQLGWGAEARALSVGFVRTSKLVTPDDSLVTFYFSSRKPLDSVFRIQRFPLPGR